MGWEILDRMEGAVAKVRERLLRATSALNEAGIPYAVVGGHAVASWVAKIDEGAVRNCPNTELLIHRDDSFTISNALEAVGFLAKDIDGIAYLLDGPRGKKREAVQLFLSEEDSTHAHEFDTISDPAGFRVLNLAPLVSMNLTQNRNVNRMYVRDLIEVGLVDRTWTAKLAPVLAERLRQILDTPGG